MRKFYDMTASPSIVVGPIPIQEIMEKLKDVYQAQEIDTTVFPAYMLKMQQNNAYYYAQGRHMDIQLEDINIKAIRIPFSNLTKGYFKKDFTAWSLNGKTDKNGIIVVYDENTNYFYCNSSMLHLEINFVRGISQEAVTYQTEDYTEYLGLQKRYLDTYSSLD